MVRHPHQRNRAQRHTTRQPRNCAVFKNLRLDVTKGNHEFTPTITVFDTSHHMKCFVNGFGDLTYIKQPVTGKQKPGKSTATRPALSCTTFSPPKHNQYLKNTKNVSNSHILAWYLQHQELPTGTTSDII